MKRKFLKKRETPKISKRKIVAMINFFENFIDEEIVSIEPHGNWGLIKGKHNLYHVDISRNKILLTCPDPDFN